MCTLAKYLTALLVSKAHAYWNTACKTLCKCGYVRLYVVKLRCEELAGSANACLYLVCDSEDIPLCTLKHDSVHKALLKRYNSALALNKLEHYSADLVVKLVELVHKIVNIISDNILKSTNEREEVVVENLLSCCRKSAKRSAVETVYKGNDDISLSVLAVFVKAVFSCKLDSALVSLCARVAEEHFLIACCLAKSFCKVSLYLCVIIV